MAKYRQERVASEILHELSGIILLEVKDPRVHDITLTDVTMSSDLSVASVRYFCAVGNLARIYLAAGDDEKAKMKAGKFNDPAYEKVEKWMPASLVKDLKKKNLL